MPCAAIIVASGSSRRMGFDKLAATILGIPVLRHSVNAFMSASGVDHVIVVCPKERFEALLSVSFPKPITRVEGGLERQNSVEAGLAALNENDDLVAIHDGARPLVHPTTIDQCINAARQHQSAALARPVTETLKRSDDSLFSDQGIDRSNLWYTETPQVFSSDLIRRAYAHVRQSGLSVTDEVSAVATLGVRTKLVLSPSPNLKITLPADIQLAAALLA